MNEQTAGVAITAVMFLVIISDLGLLVKLIFSM